MRTLPLQSSEKVGHLQGGGRTDGRVSTSICDRGTFAVGSRAARGTLQVQGRSQAYLAAALLFENRTGPESPPGESRALLSLEVTVKVVVALSSTEDRCGLEGLSKAVNQRKSRSVKSARRKGCRRKA